MTLITRNTAQPFPFTGWWAHPNPPVRLSSVFLHDAPLAGDGIRSIQYLFPPGLKGGNGPGMTGHGSGNAPAASNMKVDGKPVDELYISLYFRYSEGWQQPTSGQSKMFYTYQLEPSNRHVVFPLLNRHASPFRLQMTFSLGGQSGIIHNPNIAPAEIEDGRWYLLEMLMKRASAPGANDAEIRYWIDGTLVGQYLNLNRTHLPFTEFNGNPVWGGGGGTVQAPQYLWLHNVYLSGRSWSP